MYLDIGCRDGFLTNLIAKETGNPTIFGVDLVDLNCAGKSGINCVKFDLEGQVHLPFKDKSFDLITCNEVLEHVRDTDFLIEEIYRLLRDDGCLLLSIPRLDSLLCSFLLLLGYQPIWVESSIKRRYGGLTDGMITGHVSYFTRRAMMEFLRAHDLKVIDSAQVSVVSQWLLDQYILGKNVSLIKRFVCGLLNIIPFKQDNLIILSKKGALSYEIPGGIQTIL
jgi:SAM-dependent methyltransferase